MSKEDKEMRLNSLIGNKIFKSFRIEFEDEDINVAKYPYQSKSGDEHICHIDVYN